MAGQLEIGRNFGMGAGIRLNEQRDNEAEMYRAGRE
jgi:hypothetical protein